MPSFTKSLVTILLALSTLTAALPTPQLAGEGDASKSILSSTDDGVGHGVENAEDQLAGNIATLTGTTGAATAPAPGLPLPKRAAQLDKISNGAQAIGNAAGAGDKTSGITTALDQIDGSSTSGAANVGADIGTLEDSTLESAGSAVPKA
jgi:hypothetical protein